MGGQRIAHWDGATWQEVTSISGLPAARDLRTVVVDTSTQPARLHLAGDKLLRTCAISAGSPPTLACGP